jgi:hypothetical protein
MPKYINPYTDIGFKKLFGEAESEFETHFDKWVYFLKNLENFEKIPKNIERTCF